MSLVPMLFSNWADLNKPHSLLDQNFGLSLYPDQLLAPAHQEEVPMMVYLLRKGQGRQGQSGGQSTVKKDKDEFQVSLDVQQFSPDEINVKVVDKCVVVEAKHEDKKDEHGWISRQFVRKYLIPEQCDIEKISSSLSSDGVLSITAPRKDQSQNQNERSIKIEFTGKPAIGEKAKPKKAESEKK